MAIRFTCPCGKPLQAREDFAGRKMRCPACEAVLTIPAANGVAAVAPAGGAAPDGVIEAVPVVVPVPEPGPSATVAAATETVRTEVAVATVRKKAVRRVASVWGGQSMGQELSAWATGDRVRVGNADDERRRGWGRVLVFVILLLLVGAAVAAWVFRDDIADALERNERDVQENAGLAMLGKPWDKFQPLQLPLASAPFSGVWHVADFWKAVGQVRAPEEFAQLLKTWREEMERDLGLPPEAVEQIVWLGEGNPIASSEARHSLLTFVQTRQAISEKSFPAKWRDSVVPQGKGNRVYLIKRPRQRAVAFINSNVYVVGSVARVEAFVAGPTPRNEPPEWFAEEYAWAVRLKLPAWIQKAFFEPAELKPFSKIQAADFALGYDSAWQFKALLQFENKAQADDADSGIPDLQSKSSALLAGPKFELWKVNRGDGEVDELLRKMTHRVAGGSVLLQGHLNWERGVNILLGLQQIRADELQKQEASQ